MKQKLLTKLLTLVLLTLGGVINPAWGDDFEKYSGDLTEGDYLICDGQAALNTTISSNRLQYTAVTPSNNVITTTNNTIIWHIAQSGDYWTIYNAAANEYAASTGTKNQATMLDSGTDDKALWSISGTSTYNFVNKNNSSSNINAYLRKNGSYGFACYASGTGNALTLYKKVVVAPSYTITAQSNNNEYGTVSLVGSVITGSPKAGCRYASPAYTVTTGTATVSQEGNTFTVTPSSDCTVQINFEAIPCYTVTLSDDTENPMTEGSGGAGVTLPDREDVGSYTFAGWSTNIVTVETTEVPTIITAGTYHPTTNVTLYPVYTKTIGGNVESSNVFSSGSYASSVITWSIEDVVSIKQEQNGAGTAPSSSYVDAPRWYSGNLITITPSVTINSISVTASSSSYATELAGSTYTNATAEVDDKNDNVVSITPTNGNNPITITMRAQSRLSSLTVNYYGGTTFYTSTPSSQEKVTPVSITPASCAVVSGQELTMTMTCETEDVSIYYTTDGTDPTEGSTLYDNEDKPVISITTDTTIKAIGIKDGYTNSDITSVTFTVAEPCATPAFSVAAGEVEKGTTVEITCATEGATIYYTTNGDEPTTSSDVYSSPLTINAAQTIRAIATNEGNANSAVASASYTIQDYTTLPFVWNGGASSALKEKSGVTTSGLGSDYAESNAPYRVKFDTDNDYIQVKTNAQPGRLYIGVKMLGGENTSTITVQESADGTSFTDVEGLTISGASNAILSLESSNAFAADTRYVRLNFTKGSNVGVGPITITGCEAVTVTSAGYATYASTSPLDFTGKDIQAYIAEQNGTTGVTFTQVYKVPANTGVLLYYAGGTTENIPVFNGTGADAVTGNVFVKGTGVGVASVDGNYHNYILNNKGGVIGFYRAAGQKVGTNRAYIHIDESAAIKEFIALPDFEDDATSIQNSKFEIQNEEAPIYNLAGQRLSKMQKGINIVNGKKIMVK